MIVSSIDECGEEPFFKLCKDFYCSGGTQRGFDKELALKTFKQVISKKENLWGFFIFENETNLSPVGYALITSYWCNEDGGNVVVLDELYIDTMYRNRGYGKAFLVWLEEEFKDRATSITLEVLSTNTCAKSIYAKDGLLPDGFVTLTKRIS